MKRVLVCDDDTQFIKKVIAGTESLASKVHVDTALDLDWLLARAGNGVEYDAIFLDGFLGDGTTTIPFLEMLVNGKYPHLKKTKFFLISSDSRMQHHQYLLLVREEKVTEENRSRLIMEMTEDDRRFWSEADGPSIGASWDVELWESTTCNKDQVIGEIHKLVTC